jgi:hypothetical protein
MEKDTYDQEEIINFIAEHLEAIRVNDAGTPLFQDYDINWTPTVIFLDFFGRENHRSVGYLGPDEFTVNALLALGKIYSSNANFTAAKLHLDQVMKQDPHPDLVAEAIFYSGINRYRQTGKSEWLKKAAERLQRDYPRSSWTAKATPYCFVQGEAAA